MKTILLLLSMLLTYSIHAQQNTTTQSHTIPETGVRITTTITPLEPLESQIKRLEQQWTWAKQQPELVENGTAAKYEMALKAKKEEFEAVELEKKRLEKIESER